MMKTTSIDRWLVVASNAEAARRYTVWLSHSGIRAVAVFPGDRPEPVTDYAALLLAGGGDVAPKFYGAVAERETTGVNEVRDRLEMTLMQSFLRAGTPVFGICRGIQIANVVLGGGLIQHVPRYLSELDAPADGETHGAGNGQDAAHEVVLDRTTRLGAALSGVTAVNSAHHQAVAPDRVGAGLRVVCRSPAGVIEAVEGPEGLALSAVQWHPERLPFDHPASSSLLAFWQGRAGRRSA